jgi:hypothetical protein
MPVDVVGLVLEPLTYDQAKQLGIHEHCFTHQRAIRDDLTTVTLKLPFDEQILIARMAEDVGEHCRLRHVRIPSVTISKRDSSEGGASTKSKKVGPQQPTLRATFHCLIDPAEPAHMKFLALNFGKSFFFSFEDEQENLFTGMHAADDDGDDDQPAIPGMDDDAGDVLDEQAAANARINKETRRRRQKTDTTPTLAKRRKAAKDVH